MISRTKKFEIPHGNGDILHKVRLFSQDCEATGDVSEHMKFEFLESIWIHRSLSMPGGLPFEKMELEYNGKCWQATVSTLERKNQVI